MTARKRGTRPVGRPSLYRPEYCQRVIELGKQGYSMTSMAAALDVDKASVQRWRDEHEDFRAALSRALTYAQDWWEKAGMAGMLSGKDFNALIWKTSMQARFRDDYTERKVQEITGANGGAIEMQATRVDITALEPEQRDQLKAILLQATKGKTDDDT